MNVYLSNSKKFAWGSDSSHLNPEKIELLDKFAKGKVIDIGCGSGRYANYLSSKGHISYAVDNQRQFIEAASQQYPQVTFKQASAYKLPFKKNEFDTAILFDVIEHLDDARALEEAMRVAKRIIISVPLENHPLLLKWSLAHHHYMDKTHKREYSQKTLIKLINGIGLKKLYLNKALPISIYGLAVDHLAKNRIQEFALRVLLRPFLPETKIHSALFAVVEKRR